ncbi:unnamed protein product [Kuraishia capsulata CBS 1993]|uniref:Peptidase A1 domain-containing protein n=1 Tax=Kuraishia capsulata CBS 1993 TaxID=1382522 RepID=W6MW22_9ASCO|nr:uncharacterized protein KUCA_T00002784001 [Kuraishia capsulata CBS 1993]CDK26810.1 unnamed protein product [Kuraishia capsulata CBS 1993]
MLAVNVLAVLASVLPLVLTDDLPYLKLIPSYGEVYDYKFEIGKPAQNVSLRLDIGSGDIWIPNLADFPNCTTEVVSQSHTRTIASTETASGCPSNGLYDIELSKSGHYFNQSSQLTINASYVNGNESDIQVNQTYLNYIEIFGNYVEDEVTFKDDSGASYKLPDFVFVSANDSNVYSGGLGLGAPSGSSTSFLKAMVEEGYINSSSYSLSLNGINASYAELILGGLDSDRFIGPLVEFDYIPILDTGETFGFAWSNDYPVIPLTGLGVTSSSGKSLTFSRSFTDGFTSGSYPRPALLDSRLLYSFLPYSTLIEIAVQVNAYYSSDLDTWLVNCNVSRTGFLDFHFGNLTVMIPLVELLYEAYDNNNTLLRFQNGDTACSLAILPDYYTGYTVLGTPFLRSIYMAVDVDSRKIAMGQANPAFISKAASEELTTTSLVGFGNSTARSHTRSAIDPDASSIPFAVPNNVTSYSSLTLTVTNDYTSSGMTASSASASTALISNGEVIIGGGKSQSSSNISASAASDVSGSYSKSSKAIGSSLALGKTHVFGGLASSTLWQIGCGVVFVYMVLIL